MDQLKSTKASLAKRNHRGLKMMTRVECSIHMLLGGKFCGIAMLQ